MVLVKAWFTGLTGSELGQEHKGGLRKKKNIIKEMEWVIRTFRHGRSLDGLAGHLIWVLRGVNRWW